MIFGEEAILKVFRRPHSGPNPDLEIPRALHRAGSPHVAPPLGWMQITLDDVPTVLAILSTYLRAATDGWLLAATSVRDLYASDAVSAAEAGGDFAAEAHRLGEATAEVHRALAERRDRAPALRDVAGMLRSLDYAARHQLPGHADQERAHAAARDWVSRNQAAFCAGYAQAGGTDPGKHAVLLRALTLDKAVYEVMYEASHRPSWLSIPLESIADA